MKKQKMYLFPLCVFFLILGLLIGRPVMAADPGKDGLVGVIVKLEDAPLAAYNGGVEGLAATNTAVTGEKRLNVRSERSRLYVEHLARKMQAMEKSIQAMAPRLALPTVTLWCLEGLHPCSPGKDRGNRKPSGCESRIPGQDGKAGYEHQPPSYQG